jgi:hypothetical protein
MTGTSIISLALDTCGYTGGGDLQSGEGILFTGLAVETRSNMRAGTVFQQPGWVVHTTVAGETGWMRREKVKGKAST